MAMNIENTKKLRYLWLDGHEINWIQAFIKIVDKDLKLVPFILTPEQRKFMENLQKYCIVLKSRQLGLTVCIIALSIRQCVVHPNSNCLLVSHDQKSCNDIFDKLKQQFNSLPNWLRPKTIANNRQEIKMCNGSKITCCTAGNNDVGRGATLNLVHLSEFSLWKNPKRQLNSITQALVAEGRLIIESTPCGLNYFHDLYFQAKNNENSYKSFFFNWINGSTLFKKDYKNSVKIYKAKNNNKMLTKDELSEEELELLKLNCSMEQLMWRRLKIASSGLDLFHQEFPSTEIEGFVSTGQNIFSNERIAQIRRSLKKNNYIPKNNITDLPQLLKKYYGRSFFIYKLKNLNSRYFIGCDLSEGIGLDYSVCEVFNEDGEQVAEFYNNKIKPYQMAEIINILGHYYNKALLNIERASGGNSVIERLRYNFKYMRIYKQKMFDENNKIIARLGFDTKTKSKGIIINDLIEAFDTGQIQINSIRILEEMQVFEIKDNGSMGAASGQHDDSVMAAALTLYIIKHSVNYKW
jgi:hypothetical protein